MNTNFYQTGGTLPANSPSYIPREADRMLYDYLKDAKYCYVLNARQIGKSSLRVRTSKRLEEEGYRCVNIDMTAIGSQNIEVKEWYFSLVLEIIEQLELDMDEFIDYWDGLENITIIHRLGKIIDRVLERCDESIVIFIDEIDSILGIDIFSADDFFAVIRTFYNLRSEDIRYNRLSFAIFGVARAEDLMRDASRTPFNIAHAIKLTQLSLKESMPLLDGLTNQTIPPKEILQKVFDYTSGTPYLTQKILSRIASHPIEQLEDIDTIVHQLFIQDGFKESNISNIQQRIVGDTSYNVTMLHLVAQMIEGRCLANESDNAQIYLKLSGVAKSENGFLVYNNAIYQTLFDKPWLEETLAKIDRPFAKDLNRWVELQYDKSALLRGEVLKKAKEWAENRDDLSHNENAYLRKSIENEAQIDRIKTLWLSSIIILIVSIGLVYYYFENREYKVKLDNTASGIDNRLSILKNATKDDREYQNYTIPTHIDEVVKIDEELLKHYGIVDRALVKSHSAIVQILFNTIEFNYSEKVSWFNTLPSMSDTQKEEFFKILQTKAKQDYRKIGNQFALDGQYAQALTAYQKAIEINPKDDKAYNNIGNAYYNLKEYDKALTAYQKAIEINPKDAKVYHSMGVAYAYLNEYDKALTAFQKAIEINPKNDSTYILMGISYGVLNEYEKALTAFQKAVAINPKFDYPYIYMGNAYRNLKEYDKALTAYQKAIEINPQNDEAYYNMGNAYYNLKEYDKAITAYQKAIEINPKYGNAYTNMFELQLIRNQDFSLEVSFLTHLRENQETMMKYEMLTILRSIAMNRSGSSMMELWRLKYRGVGGLDNWDWGMIDKWIESMGESDTKAKLIEAVGVFKSH